MSQLNFDASQHAPQQALDPIPAGWYVVQATDSAVKPTQKGDGSYAEFELTVLEGEYAGRKVYARINLDNPNAAAVEIGQGQLSALCHATRVIQVQDTQQLHGIPFEAKVSVRAAGKGKDGNDYEASNDVKGFRAVQQAAAAPAQVGPPAFGGMASAAAPAPAPQWQPPAAPPQQPAAAPQWQPPQQPAQAPPQQPAQQQAAPAPAPEPQIAQQPAQAGQQPPAAPPWAQQG